MRRARWKSTSLSSLVSIRRRCYAKALLTDEERDQDATVETVERTPTQDGAIRAEKNAQPPNWPGSEAEPGDEAKQSAARSPEAKQPELVGAPASSAVLAAATAPAGNVPPQNEGPSDSPLLRPHTCRHFSPKTKMPRRKRFTVRE